jgi:hypothetical protein
MRPASPRLRFSHELVKLHSPGRLRFLCLGLVSRDRDFVRRRSFAIAETQEDFAQAKSQMSPQDLLGLKVNFFALLSADRI